MDEKLKALLDAGLKVTLSKQTLGEIDKLSLQEVKALAKICRKLSDPTGRRFLVYSEWASDQPPGGSY
ncbi:MAG: hypothetical protein ACJ76J_05915 [Thermoanaerobaculia bacterium]